jgi:hypothetical protein
MFAMRFRQLLVCVAMALPAGGLTLLNAFAQQLPRLQEENLVDQTVVLPDAAAGKVAVLVLGFSQASKNPTSVWAKRIWVDHGETTGFALYQLAVLEAVPRMFRSMIISSIRKGIPEDQRPNFLPVVHNEAELQKLVGFKEADDAYIIVLDRSGKVAYQTHSASVDPAYVEFRSALAELLK